MDDRAVGVQFPAGAKIIWFSSDIDTAPEPTQLTGLCVLEIQHTGQRAACFQ